MNVFCSAVRLAPRSLRAVAPAGCSVTSDSYLQVFAPAVVASNASTAVAASGVIVSRYAAIFARGIALRRPHG